MSAHGKPGHGSRCSCDECREERAAYKRGYRARQRGLTEAPTDTADVVTLEGPVTRATRAEIAMCSGAATRPALAETALVMAAGLDDRRLATGWPSLARQHMLALAALHAASAPSTRRLATVATLSDRR